MGVQRKQRMTPSDKYLDFQAAHGHFHLCYFDADYNIKDVGLDQKQYVEDLSQQRYLEELIKPLPIKKGDTIVEIGCGSGVASIWLAKEFGCVVHAVDLMEHNVLTAKENVKNENLDHLVHVHRMDALEMNFPAESIDHVFSIEAIYHIADKKMLFSKIKEVLKPGGSLTFSDYTLNEPYSTILYDIISEIFESKEIIQSEEYFYILNDIGFVNINSVNVTENTIVPTLHFLKRFNYSYIKKLAGGTVLSSVLVSLLAPIFRKILLRSVKKGQFTLQFISCKKI